MSGKIFFSFISFFFVDPLKSFKGTAADEAAVLFVSF